MANIIADVERGNNQEPDRSEYLPISYQRAAALFQAARIQQSKPPSKGTAFDGFSLSPRLANLEEARAMDKQSATTADGWKGTRTECSLPVGWKTASECYGPHQLVTIMTRTPHSMENTDEGEGWRIVLRVEWQETPGYDELENFRREKDAEAGEPQEGIARDLECGDFATVAAELMQKETDHMPENKDGEGEKKDGEVEKKDEEAKKKLVEILTSLLGRVFCPSDNILVPVPDGLEGQEGQVVTPLHTGHVAGGLAWRSISEMLESTNEAKDDICCRLDLDLADLVNEMGKRDLTDDMRTAVARALCKAIVSSVAMTRDVHISVRLTGHIDTLLTEADPEDRGWPGQIIQMIDATLCRIGRFVKSPEGIRIRAGKATSQCVEIGHMRMAALAQTTETGVVMHGTVHNTNEEDSEAMMAATGLDEVSANLARVRRRTGSLPTQLRGAGDVTSLGQMSNVVHPSPYSGLKDTGAGATPIQRSASLPTSGGVSVADAGGLGRAPTRLVRLVDGKVVTSPGWTKYAAVSYCWNQWEKRDAELWREIIHTLHGSDIQYCWIDRWCIDQDDQKDKQKEVPKMGGYYMGAAVTIAMLPDVAIPTVLQRWALRDIQYRPVETAMELRQVIERSMWFTRAWTLQEALLSRNLAVRTADCTVNLQTLEVMAGFGDKAKVPLIIATNCQHRDMTLSLSWGATPPSCRKDERSVRMYNDNDFMGGRGIFTPLEVAKRLKNREATKQHDMIYAVMGLMDAHQLEVDYDMSYSRLTREALLQWGLTDWALRTRSFDESAGSCWAPKQWYEVQHDEMVRCERLLSYHPNLTENGLIVQGVLVKLTNDDGAVAAETAQGERMSLIVGAGQLGDGTALLAPTTEKDVHLLVYGQYCGEGMWHRSSSSLAYTEDRPKVLREGGLVREPSSLQEWCVGRTTQRMVLKPAEQRG